MLAGCAGLLGLASVAKAKTVPTLDAEITADIKAGAITRDQYRAFRNGCFPAAVIMFDPPPSDPELERIYAKFMKQYQGDSRFGKPIILPSGVKSA